jgi:putative ABC transport system substrate-binding protein
VLLTPVCVVAQAPPRVATVGVLVPGSPTMVTADPARAALERGLKELGWAEGQNLRIVYRYAEGRPEQLDGLARQLVRLPADVIVARSTVSIRAARQATTNIPIVMSASGVDPVQAGFVASLARPGGHVTGLTLLNQDLPVKQLELLKEVVPRLSRVAVLGSTSLVLAAKAREGLEAAAKALGVLLQHVDVEGAGDLDQAFADIARGRAGALIVRADPIVLEPNERQVIALAAKHRLPAVYWLRAYAAAGGLMSYGANLFEVHHRSAYFVDRILKGTQPRDLPVEEPSKFSLVVNLKAAQALGLTFPPSLQARANEIIK